MPYQPINPVPHNIGIEANKDNYEFSFTIDKYDKVEKVEIRIYDLYDNSKHLYTITRSHSGKQQFLQIDDEINKEPLLKKELTENELMDFSELPLIGGKEESVEFYLPLGLIDNVTDFDITSLFRGNKKYTWNVKLTGNKHDVWITENNTFADKESTLPTVYVPNNTKMEVNQQIVLGGDSTYRINNIDTYSQEGKIYYRQSKGKSTNTLNCFSILNGYITYEGITGTVTKVKVDNDILPYLRVGTQLKVTDVSMPIDTQEIVEIIKEDDGYKLILDPGFEAQNKDFHENLITIVTNEDGTEGALITTGMIPSEWIYVFTKGTTFSYKGIIQTISEVNPIDYSITFKPGFISTEEGDLIVNINLTRANNILPSDLNDYDILIIGNEEIKTKFAGDNADLTDMHITLNYINYFQVENIQQYPNSTTTDYSQYGLKKGEMLFKVTATEIINPTKYQVDSPDLAKDYLLERQSSILTVDPNALKVVENVANGCAYTFKRYTKSWIQNTQQYYLNFVLDLTYTDDNLRYIKVEDEIECGYEISTNDANISTKKFITTKIKEIKKSSDNYIVISTYSIESLTDKELNFENKIIFVKNNSNADNSNAKRLGRIIVDVTNENAVQIQDLSSKYITFESFVNMQNKIIENEGIKYVFDNIDNNNKKEKVLFFEFPADWELEEKDNFQGNIITNNLVYIFDRNSEDNDEYIPLILTSNDNVSANQSFIIYADYIVSPYYFFSVLPEREIEFFLETKDGLQSPDENKQFHINSTRAKIIAEYEGNIAYYTWKLVRDNGEKDEEVIEQTKEEFTSYMEYEYEMLEPGTYKLILIVTTKEGCSLQSTVILKVDYEIINNPFDIEAEADCDKKAIKVSFSNFKQIKGYVYKQDRNGKYFLIGDNTKEGSSDGFEITSENSDDNEQILKYYNCYIKPGYKIQWDRIMPLDSNRYIDISKDFTLISRFKLGNKFTGNILELIDMNNISYSLSLNQEGENINFIMKKGIDFANQETKMYTESALELQTETKEESIGDVLYYYFDFENMEQEKQLDFESSKSKFIIEKDPISEEWFTIVMKKTIVDGIDNMRIEIYKGDISEDNNKPVYELELPSTVNDTNYYKLIAYGNINWNYIHVFNKSIETNTISQLLYENNYIPKWNQDTYMLINFASDENKSYNIDSIPHNTEYLLGTLYKYVVFRSEIDDNGQETVKRKIGEIQPFRTAFYDYAIEKKRKYVYTIIPYFLKSDEDIDTNFITTGSPMMTNEEGVSLFYDYVSLYSGVALYLNQELSAEGSLKQSENTYILDNTQKPWYFKYNLESGDITVNTDKNVFEGLFPYAKVNKGLKNYRTGNITALIGEFKGEGNDLSSLIYYDSIKMANEFQAFCDSNTVKILRDEMGNVIPVDITLKSIKYDNKNMPTTITVSFEWTQVGSYDDISLFEVEGGNDE